MQIKINRKRIDELRKEIQKAHEYNKIWTTNFVYEGERVYLKEVKRK